MSTKRALLLALILLPTGALAYRIDSPGYAAPPVRLPVRVVTVYHATPEQTDGDPLTTADGSRLTPEIIAGGHWCAVSQDLLWFTGGPLHFGDTIRVTGIGKLSGTYTVKDTMATEVYRGGAWEPVVGYVDLLVSENVMGYWDDNITVYLIGSKAMKHEPRGMVAPPQRNELEGLQAEMEVLLVTVAGAMKLRESLQSGGTAWQFPTIDEWEEHFTTLETALPLLATLTAAKRYLWWICGDTAEALLRKFGRTQSIKASIASAFGCKVRSIEYRVRAAVQFPPEVRYPDVPTELYRESLSWPDPTAALEAALEKGSNSYQLQTERWKLEGRTMGSPIWRSVSGNMTWEERNGRTTYTITIVEEGGCRFADNELSVVISVSPSLQLTDGT